MPRRLSREAAPSVREEKLAIIGVGAIGVILWALSRHPTCAPCPTGCVLTCPLCQTCHDQAIGCVPDPARILAQGASGSVSPGAAILFNYGTAYPIASVTPGAGASIGQGGTDRYAISGQLNLVSSDPTMLFVDVAYGPFPGGTGGLGAYFCPMLPQTGVGSGALANPSVLAPGLQSFQVYGDLSNVPLGTPVQLFLVAVPVPPASAYPALSFPGPVKWSQYVPCPLTAPCPTPAWLGP